MKKYILMIIVLLFSSSIMYAQEVVIIANKGVSDGSVSKAKAGKIYELSSKNWGNGTKIKTVDLKSGPSKNKFYKYIGKSAKKLKKIWLKKKLTEGASTPIVVSSDDEMVAKVASTSGAIGYCDKSKATGSVKIIGTVK